MNFITVQRPDGRVIGWALVLVIMLVFTCLIYIIGLPLWLLVSLGINSAVAQSGLKIPFEGGVPVTFGLVLLISSGIVAQTMAATGNCYECCSTFS